MKKFIFILCFALLAAVTTTKAQTNYETALGVRIGSPSGISLQHYVSGSSALEGILGFGNHWFTLTGLYEYHHSFAETAGLGWYIGFGGHIGGISNSYDYNNHLYDNGFIFGIDGVLGIDYTFATAPINLSLDWKPNVNLTPYSDFYPGDFGFSIRYTFGR